jgi:hypothetical protein
VLTRLRPVLLSPWTLLGAATVLVVMLGVRGCNRDAAARRELARIDEAARLQAKQVLVAAREREAALRLQLDAATRGNADLRQELERVRRATPGAKVVFVEHLSTGAVVSDGLPRAPEERGQAAVPPACLLAVGDLGEVVVDEVHLETRAGNRVVAGTGVARRVRPGPETRLFGGPFRAPLSSVAEKAPPEAAAPRWGFGGGAAASDRGAGASLVVGTPSARVPLLGWRVEAVGTAAGGLGGGGWYAATANVLIRP